jgi:hypothetical protein
MYGLLLREFRANQGTTNFMPRLSAAQTLEDFGALSDVVNSAVDWWNSETAVTYCGAGCAKAWNGAATDQFAPQENKARNGDRVTDAMLSLASMPPFGVPAKMATAARGAAAARGTTVLGHFPEYLVQAERLRARRFSVPVDAWNKMSSVEQWAANRRFLDRLILRGDRVVLTTSIDAIRQGSALEREVEYLLGRGYTLLDDGLTLVK